MAKKMTDKITDFGEKIGGARKDLWKSRGLCEDMGLNTIARMRMNG